MNIISIITEKGGVGSKMFAGFFILFYFFLPQLQNIQQEYPASSIVSHNCHQIVQRGY
mgnify:CR=1 FL=1